MPNCSAICSGEWFGSITPPEPSVMRSVCAATWAMSTLVAADAIEPMLWCSAYQIRRNPQSSARCASLVLASRPWATVSPRATVARSRIDNGSGSGMTAPHGSTR